MNISEVFEQFRHDDRFAGLLRRHEISQLVREGEHLKSKCEERELTSWESERLLSLVQELVQMIGQLGEQAKA